MTELKPETMYYVQMIGCPSKVILEIYKDAQYETLLHREVRHRYAS